MSSSMKKVILALFFGVVFVLLQSCAPSVSYISKDSIKRVSKPSDYNIIVYKPGDKLPSNAKIIGSLYIGDTGFSVRCGLDDVIRLAKKKAREVGGDAIQITEIDYPDLTSTCYRIKANVIVFEKIKTPSNWPCINKDENEFRKYFDSHIDSLDPIEGIWMYQESGTWRNVLSGITGNLPKKLPYRLAIIRNTNTTNQKYDFVAVILESEYKSWKPGFVKAYFRKTAYEKVYECLWYMRDFSAKKYTYLLKDDGLIESSWTSYNPPIEVIHKSLLIKAYPPVKKSIYSKSNMKLKSFGTGFLISPKGLIVTAYHVVKSSNKIEVIFPEKSITKEAVVKIRDIQNDIAILELKDFTFSSYFNQSIPFVFSNSKLVKVGEEVFTLGFPLGNILGNKPRLSTGRINSLYGIQDDPRLFQISNPLQPGNSGGPLFNHKGELIGIVVSSLNAKYFYENAGIIPQNVNFAIKGNYVSNLISILPEYQELCNRKNLLLGKSLEEKIELVSPFIVTIK